jgi:hypothetical protein
MGINLDAIIPVLIVVGMVIGVVVWNILVWVWPFAKLFLHTITA